MLEIFVKILDGYLYFENRQGGCECKYAPPDHKNVTRLYFGKDKKCIESLARISMRRECWIWRPVEHRHNECYKELVRMNMLESKDTPENEKRLEDRNTSEDDEEMMPSFETNVSNDFDDNERWTPDVFERRRKQKVQEMFDTYWTNRDARDIQNTTTQNVQHHRNTIISL
jgi:hypothetical protein